MNKMFGVLLAAVMLAGPAGAAPAASMDQPCEAQLRAQVQALQTEVSALQAGDVVQTDTGTATGYSIPSGG